METLKSVARSTFKSSRRAIESPPPPSPSFPKFPDLPIELRVNIWRLAIDPRILPIHLHNLRSDESDLDVPPVLDISDNETDEEDLAQAGEIRPRIMCMTTCSLKHPCGCWGHPPSTSNTVPPPVLLSTCRESRDACIECYSRKLDKFYNYRGREVRLTSSSSILKPSCHGFKPWDPSNIGITMYPAVDIPLIKFNVASHSSIAPLLQFVRIASKESNEINRIAVQLYTAMPPYKFWQGSRFTYWKNWGSGTDWIPREVVKFPNLREVILVVGVSREELLPIEWQERTISIWEDALIGMRSRWPVEWEGNMPRLRFVTKLEDIPGALSPSSLPGPAVEKPLLTRVGELPLRGLEVGVESFLKWCNRNN